MSSFFSIFATLFLGDNNSYSNILHSGSIRGYGLHNRKSIITYLFRVQQYVQKSENLTWHKHTNFNNFFVKRFT